MNKEMLLSNERSLAAQAAAAGFIYRKRQKGDEEGSARAKSLPLDRPGEILFPQQAFFGRRP